MARNRRKVEGEVTLAWLATRLMLFVMLVGFLLGILFLKSRNLKMGDEIRNLDHDLKLAQEKTSGLEVQLARCKTPREIEMRMVKMHIHMVAPVKGQVCWFPEPEAWPGSSLRPRMFVQTESSRLSP